MRGVRVRELILVVAVVALALGWWIDRVRLVEAHRNADLAAQARLAASEGAAKLFMQMASREGARRMRAEAALAECEEGGPMSDDAPRYFAGGRALADREAIRPDEAVAVPVVDRPGAASPTVGVAYPSAPLPPSAAEAGWRLVVRGMSLPGVRALRRGEFVLVE